jgi:hypothetical protein
MSAVTVAKIAPLPEPDTMHDYQREFLDTAIACQALRFGEFTLKSGRISPYFFNAGRFDNGQALDIIGRSYASTLAAAGLSFDMRSRCGATCSETSRLPSIARKPRTTAKAAS